MIRSFTAAALLCTALSALSLGEIGTNPPGHVRNFLLWEYLQEEVTPDEALRAFALFDGVNTKLYSAYAKRSDDPDVLESIRCMGLSASQLLTEKEEACVTLGLSPYKAAALDDAGRTALAKRLKTTPFADWLEFIAETNATTPVAELDPAQFASVARRAGQNYRRTYLDRDYPPEFMQQVSRSSSFNVLAALVVTDPEMVRFQRSLLALDDVKLDAQTHFFLALNQLRHGYKKEALHHLEQAREHFYYQMDKDKARFWQYLITQDPKLLETLADESDDINIYTLYVNELLERPVENYFTTLETGYQEPSGALTDPFTWERILDEIRATPKEQLFDLAKAYRSEAYQPVQAFILERAYRYKTHNYILPYRELMKEMTPEKQCVMLSLMRQESRFIPSALSRSYALGLMQMMPFLVRAMDKEAKQPTGSLHKMFEPATNIDYASRHLDYLQKHLYHPLLIAYAYNGGIGFTKRMLQAGAFADAPYEPFMSMEMMVNSETREYGKKVLANYVVYKRIFGQSTSILRLFENLKYPSRTDRFRTSR